MINQRIINALESCVGKIPPKHEIELIKDESWGDFASNLPFILAQEKKVSAKLLAEELAKKLVSYPDFAQVLVGGNGFLNFTISDKLLQEGLRIASDEDFGKSEVGRGEKILLEYVSANPTGPLNVVQARAAALGNALGNILRFAGFSVTTEYYVNDSGTQVELLYQSLLTRIKELKGEKAELPEGGYPGKYLLDIAKEILTGRFPETEWRQYLLTTILKNQQSSLAKFGIHFDNFVNESKFIDRIDEVLKKLAKVGKSYEKEGALWFRATDFGDTEDRVLLTKEGRPTYFITDLAYHIDKLARGFDRLINIWGPDHHGYIARLKGGIAALGYPSEKLEIIIAQQVSLLKEKEKIAMSKRAGEFITLDEVMDEISSDALKFFLLLRKASQHLEFDIALAKKSTQENPVYYVQYAHARICNILKFALEKGTASSKGVNLSLLHEPEERRLAKLTIYFPDVIERAALLREPHRLVYFLLDIATAFHYFYERQRVVTDNKELTQARLYLCQCVQKVLANGLSLIGVSTPEKM
uniref:Arginine--tRNA ligase n=1 Tax=candidate division WOR-3 bacterium TaxID=2052148 RepID=A0A7C6EC47_UNCW3